MLWDYPEERMQRKAESAMSTSRPALGRRVVRLITTGIVIATCAASSLGCNKHEKSGEATADKPAEKAETGCGKDYGDPAKQLCLTLPKNYTVSPKIEKSDLYAELINVDGPDMGDGVTLTVGFTSTNFTKYEEQLAAEEQAPSGYQLEASGSTPNNSGKWWVRSQGKTKIVSSIVKAPNGKAAMCSTSNLTPSAAAIEVCKTLRPFPGG